MCEKKKKSCWHWQKSVYRHHDEHSKQKQAALPFPGSANTVRVRLCRPSVFLVEQLCEQGDQEDQDPVTQSAEQATSQATSVGGGSPSQCVTGTSSPERDGMRYKVRPMTFCVFEPDAHGTIIQRTSRELSACLQSDHTKRSVNVLPTRNIWSASLSCCTLSHCLSGLVFLLCFLSRVERDVVLIRCSDVTWA